MFHYSALDSAQERRYEWAGLGRHLTCSISLQQEPVKLTSHGAPQRPIRNLADSLEMRFHQSGRVEDLRPAIALFRDSLKDMPRDSEPFFSLTTFARAFTSHSELTGSIWRFSRAIAAYKHACFLDSGKTIRSKKDLIVAAAIPTPWEFASNEPAIQSCDYPIEVEFLQRVDGRLLNILIRWLLSANAKFLV